jgi:RHS repeat-associated protein
MDSSSVIQDHIDYDGYGNATHTTITVADQFGYAGGLYSYDTKMEQFGARWYDAATGRWVSQDPSVFGGGDTNLQRYCGNGPTNATDPSGLKVKLVLREAVTSDTYYHVTIIWYDNTGWVRYDGGGTGTKKPGHPDRPNYHRTPATGTTPGSPPTTGQFSGGWDVVRSKYKTDAEELKALDDAYGKLIQLPYDMLNPNSNTYAHQLLNLAGFSVQPLYLTYLSPPHVEGIRPPNPQNPTGNELTNPPEKGDWLGWTLLAEVGPTAVMGWDTSDYGGPKYDEWGRERGATVPPVIERRCPLPFPGPTWGPYVLPFQDDH